jgi:hypothetical protein
MNCWPRKETDVDDILLEVQKAREAYAKEFGYDLQAIHRDLHSQETGERSPDCLVASPAAEADDGKWARFTSIDRFWPHQRLKPAGATSLV